MRQADFNDAITAISFFRWSCILSCSHYSGVQRSITRIADL